MSVNWELEFLNQVNVHFPLEDKVLKRPNDIPNGSNHVLVRMGVDLQLVLYDFHPLNLIVVVVPYSLGRLLDADGLLKSLQGLRPSLKDLLKKVKTHSLNLACVALINAQNLLVQTYQTLLVN